MIIIIIILIREALFAARAATNSLETERISNPADWLRDELRVTGLLIETAQLASEQARHRDALRTLHQAERRLGQTERGLPLFAGETARSDARDRLDAERSAVLLARDAVRARMQHAR